MPREARPTERSALGRVHGPPKSTGTVLSGAPNQNPQTVAALPPPVEKHQWKRPRGDPCPPLRRAIVASRSSVATGIRIARPSHTSCQCPMTNNPCNWPSNSDSDSDSATSYLPHQASPFQSNQSRRT